MAHHFKVQAGNASGGRMMLDHDKRAERPERKRANKNIDPALADQNVDYSGVKRTPDEAWAYALQFAQEHSKRKIRDNQVIMSCEVMHLPDNWDEVSGGEDSRVFFERIALPFYRQRYGREALKNEISAVLHRDEKAGEHPGADHLHYKYVPITQDGRLSHKQVNGRTDLASFHTDLQKFADGVDGGKYKGLHLYSPERAGERAAALTMPEYQAAKDRTAEAATEAQETEERLERLRQREIEERPKITRATGVQRQLAERNRELEERASQLRGQVNAAREREEIARSERDAARERYTEARGRSDWLEGEVQRLQRGVAHLAEQVRELIGRVYNRLGQVWGCTALEVRVSNELGMDWKLMEGPKPTTPSWMRGGRDLGLER